MDAGWIADRGHGNAMQRAKWIEGEPQMQRWLGITWGPTTKGKQQHEVTVWRCPRCGNLESYAL
jgi:hypothetical protein